MCSITKETWERCGIKTIDFYNSKKSVRKFRLKMGVIQNKLDHANVTELRKKELKGIYGKKKRRCYKARKRKV